MSWHLLDAVPKDGTRVLFFITTHEDEPYGPEGAMVSGWYDSILDLYLLDGGVECLPTHWRRLPSLPTNLT
jgi:hypothetical protein